jgi:hypothetical protein
LSDLDEEEDDDEGHDDGDDDGGGVADDEQRADHAEEVGQDVWKEKFKPLTSG